MNTHVLAPQPKPWWKSKTLWVNGITAALVVVETNFPLLQGQIGDKAYIATLGTLAMANVVLRFVTTSPVNLGGE